MKVFPWIPAVLVPALVACSSQLPPPLPATFVRPQRVAFACFDTDPKTKAVRPLEDCRPMLNQDGTVAKTTLVLHALVTQSDRGEVAAVDLSAMRVIDSREDIPGFTFVPAGELPGPIVVPPINSQFTYVANSGSRDISVLQTSAFRELMVGQDATKQRVRVQIDEQGAATPFDMLLSPDEDALFVTAPAAGWLLRMPIQRCPEEADATCREGEIDVAHIVVVPLDASLPQAQPMEPPMGPEVEPYSLICNPELLLPVPMAATTKIPSDVTASAPQPQPAGMALDAFCTPGEGECKRRLLVADKRLPIVHVVDLDVLAAGNARESVLSPIVTGVPTERVAVTPRVPVDINESDRETQYVYAIDATDGSVLVTRDGRLLNVTSDPTARADRLDLGRSRSGTVVSTGRTDNGSLVALSLGVLTPAFDVTAPAAHQWLQAYDSAVKSPLMCDDPNLIRTADRLRGVFLTVGLTDGTVRVVDVHDMELANCRRSCDAKPPDPYPVMRNRPRIRVAYTPVLGVAPPTIIPSVTPRFEIGNEVITINADGTTNDPRVAGLDCLTCPANEGVSFPAIGVAVSADGGAGSAGVAAGSGGVSGGAAGAGGADSGTSGTGGTGGGAGGAGGVGDAGSRDAGDASDGQAGGAAPIANPACGAGQGRVCSLADPWIDPLNWLAVYEGAIPGANGGHGRFLDSTSGDNLTGSLEFQGETRFCGAGVLGSDDIGDGHEGDQIQITSEFPAEQFADRVRQHPELAELRDDCQLLVRARDADKTAIAFRITQAYADRLVIDDTLIDPPRDLKRSRADYAFVQQCFLDMLLSFEVHVSKSYTVLSQTAASFRHRVVADPTSNRCVVNQEPDPTRTSRAYEGVVFDNGFVSFKTLAKAPPEPLTRLRLLSGSTVPKLILDVSALSGATVFGVLPVELKYNDLDQNLYVVDITARGLIPVSLAPFPSAVFSSYQ